MGTEERQQIEQTLIDSCHLNTWNCCVCGIKLANEISRCPNDGALRADMSLGESLSIKYEILEEIGSGGAALVYRAKHRIMNDVVAIKLLRATKHDQSSLRRFEQEARVVSSFDHRGIVSLRDFGVTEIGQPYMVLDYVDGITLADTIRQRSLSVPESMEVFLQLCEALAYAHLHGVVHRDIKPSNIMLIKKEDHVLQIKILDFGLAKVVFFPESQALTPSGEIFGTPTYMSPEQASNKPVDDRSDIYSLGVVMFETLALVPPFVSQSGIELVTSHMKEQAPSLRSVAPWVSASLEEIVSKTLAKDPADRFQSMSELKDALMQARSGKKTSIARENSQHTMKHKTWIVGVLLCGIVLGVSFWLSIKPFETTVPKSNVVDIEAQPIIPGTKGTFATEELAQHYNDPLVNLQDYNGKISDKDLEMFDKSTNTKAVILENADGLQGPGLAHLIHLNLRLLQLGQSNITDRAMYEISHMTSLEALDLSKTDVTDDGINKLRSLTKLKQLILKGEVNLTNKALSTVSSFESLRELNLSKNSWVSSNGLAQLSKLPLLEVLRLNVCSINDRDLRGIRNFKSLKLLGLRRTAIGDAGVAELVATSIRKLDLGETKVTDKSLPLFAMMASLSELGLHSCNVSASAIKVLQKSRPDLIIYWDGDPEFVRQKKNRDALEMDFAELSRGPRKQIPTREQDYDAPFNQRPAYF